MIVRFSQDHTDPCRDVNVVGNKGLSLLRMTEAKLPVPPGFILPVELGKSKDRVLADSHVLAGLRWLEEVSGSTLGNLKVSVRSGAAVSMPGMMDTVLNVDNTRDLLKAVHDVFESWHSDRARTYRQLNGIPHDMGTACVIQAMVFGNLGDDSGTGVVFSRDPRTGWPGLYGEYLPNAQGEAVVSGTVTPNRIGTSDPFFNQLTFYCQELEEMYRDMVDVEFTIERGKLWLLQCRSGKRNRFANVRITADLVEEGLISIKEAVTRLSIDDIKAVYNRQSIETEVAPILTGNPASNGLVTGMVSRVRSDLPYIFVAYDTTPDDIQSMAAALGVITQVGGSTSHAAVVCRAMNKPCIVGADIDALPSCLRVTMDGSTGRVWKGDIGVGDATIDVFNSITQSGLLRLMKRIEVRTKVGSVGFGPIGAMDWDDFSATKVEPSFIDLDELEFKYGSLTMVERLGIGIVTNSDTLFVCGINSVEQLETVREVYRKFNLPGPHMIASTMKLAVPILKLYEAKRELEG